MQTARRICSQEESQTSSCPPWSLPVQLQEKIMFKYKMILEYLFLLSFAKLDVEATLSGSKSKTWM